MKYLYITELYLFTIICCTSCTTEIYDRDFDNNVIICGQLINTDQTLSRSQVSQLNEGEQISFYSRYGIESEGLLLTLSNGFWKGNTVIRWSEQPESASITAYNPPINTENVSFYHPNGHLIDLLLAKDDFQFKAPIYLKFEHLFSELRFKIDNKLNSNIKELNLQPSHIIKELNPYSAEFSVIPIPEETNDYRITYKPDAKGVYSIILPPGNNQSVNIHILTQDGRSLYKQVQPINCKGNNSYICYVKEKSEELGISSAEDFIAFTHLMNGLSYKGHKLEEYGETVNDQTTYYLSNDIYLTDTDKKEVLQVGIKNKFSDIFEGQGYTIHNLGIQDCNNNHTGLFTDIGTSGQIRNLTISGGKVAFKKGATYQGVLCGSNTGKIINCHINNILFTQTSKNAGIIAGKNVGDIINCEVRNITYTINIDNTAESNIAFGGIASENCSNAKILNCRIADLSRGNDKKKKVIPYAITCIHQGEIANCISDIKDKKFHPFCKAVYAKPRFCFYSYELQEMVNKDKYITKEQCKANHIVPFYRNENSMKETVQEMNLWIDNEGRKLYSDYSFLPWIYNTIGTITFE